MTFSDERAMAERCLTVGNAEEDAFPPTAARIRAARSRLGLSPRQAADKAGLERDAYADLELYNSEIFACVDVAHLPRLAAALEIPLLQMLFGSVPSEPPAPISFEDVARAILRTAVDRGLSLDQFGDAIGWDVSAVVQNPDALGTYNLYGLHDVCAAIGLDWIGVLRTDAFD